MGQKTSACTFRLGVNKKNWELKYVEKNIEESSLYLYETLEVRKYLNRFFGLYKIKIHTCKIFYCSNSLQIFISFYITAKTIYIINKINTNKNLTRFIKKKKRKKRFISKRLQTRKKKYVSTLIKRFAIQQTIVLNEFQEILLESLTAYTNKKININITLQNLNGYKQLPHNQIKDFKIIFKQLKKFVKSSFFKETINILFLNVSKRKSAKLLAEFISDQFKLNQLKLDQVTISRKDNYFLGFLKQVIKLFTKFQNSCVTGIKIVIKGRFNRAPRAKKIIIQFGTFSIQSFDSNIDYYQSTAYTANGTFGVKVWMCEN